MLLTFDKLMGHYQEHINVYFPLRHEHRSYLWMVNVWNTLSNCYNFWRHLLFPNATFSYFKHLSEVLQFNYIQKKADIFRDVYKILQLTPKQSRCVNTMMGKRKKVIYILG